MKKKWLGKPNKRVHTISYAESKPFKKLLKRLEEEKIIYDIEYNDKDKYSYKFRFTKKGNDTGKILFEIYNSLIFWVDGFEKRKKAELKLLKIKKYIPDCLKKVKSKKLYRTLRFDIGNGRVLQKLLVDGIIELDENKLSSYTESKKFANKFFDIHGSTFFYLVLSIPVSKINVFLNVNRTFDFLKVFNNYKNEREIIAKVKNISDFDVILKITTDSLRFNLKIAKIINDIPNIPPELKEYTEILLSKNDDEMMKARYYSNFVISIEFDGTKIKKVEMKKTIF